MNQFFSLTLCTIREINMLIPKINPANTKDEADRELYMSSFLRLQDLLKDIEKYEGLDLNPVNIAAYDNNTENSHSKKP